MKTHHVISSLITPVVITVFANNKKEAKKMVEAGDFNEEDVTWPTNGEGKFKVKSLEDVVSELN